MFSSVYYHLAFVSRSALAVVVVVVGGLAT